MSADEQQLREIEAGEQWLRSVCIDPPAPDPEWLKQRVRVALEERWLGERPSERPPADLADRTKDRLRKAIAEAQEGPAESPSVAGPRRVYRVVRWACGTGLAAAACLAMYVGLQRPTVTFSPTESFLDYACADFDVSLATFDDELDDLEVALTEASTDAIDDELIDDLLDAVDQVDWDDSGGDDWSFDLTG